MDVTMPAKRESLNGCWILDKTRGAWSMNKYLETMNVDPLAIEAHEKGEKENDTIHTIDLDDKTLKLVKRSRVNSDLVVQLELVKENVELLPPGDRPKKSLALSDNPSHLRIESSLFTVNGMAKVTDVKMLLQEEDKSVMRQELTVVSQQTGRSYTTTRFFVPYLNTPPHLEVIEEAVPMEETTVPPPS
jgi:hypothetical protein